MQPMHGACTHSLGAAHPAGTDQRARPEPWTRGLLQQAFATHHLFNLTTTTRMHATPHAHMDARSDQQPPGSCDAIIVLGYALSP
jgi:hypothetical protein